MWITGLASSWPVIRPNPRTSRQPAQSHRAVLQQPRARTLPGVLFPTVNVRRKRPRSAVTNVRRAGSRPYFEWESELRRCTRLPASPPPSRPGPPVIPSSVLLAGWCYWLWRVAIDFALVRTYSGRCPLDRQYCPHCTFYDRIAVARHESSIAAVSSAEPKFDITTVGHEWLLATWYSYINVQPTCSSTPASLNTESALCV